MRAKRRTKDSKLHRRRFGNYSLIGFFWPLYREHFKIINQKEVTVNGTKVTDAMFSGNGTTKGISVTSAGKGLIIPRPGDVIYVKGRADFIAERMTHRVEKQLILLRQ